VGKIPVLVYHAIETAPQRGLERWTTSLKSFRQHIDVIAASGRASLTVSEFAECLRGERPLHGDAVVVTFDDGYASTYDAVHELMRRGIASTVYVISGAVEHAGMLSHAQLEALVRLDGVEIGAHSMSHPHLDELDSDAVEAEVSGSKRVLETMLDAPIRSFAYPHGSYDRSARAAVIAAGYRSAAAIKNAISHLEDDPFAIARWTMTAHTSPEELSRILHGDGVPLAWNQVRLRTRASRAARRTRRRLRGLTKKSVWSWRQVTRDHRRARGGRNGRD
jgi:peptidoglycan/xylan/chitin deacetylase (PgdA/CDA1 family)